MSNRRITNAEYIVNLLMDMLDYEDVPFERIHIDDGGASEEAMVFYNIECPYRCGDERAECFDEDGFYKLSDREQREICVECKSKWLLQEVDE